MNDLIDPPSPFRQLRSALTLVVPAHARIVVPAQARIVIPTHARVVIPAQAGIQ